MNGGSSEANAESGGLDGDPSDWKRLVKREAGNDCYDGNGRRIPEWKCQ